MSGGGSPLSEYFLSEEYSYGEPFEHPDYNLDHEIFVHKQTGIRTWSFALDKRPASSDEDDWQVIYHYTNEATFKLITDVSRPETLELFVSREALKDSNFGPGLYASSKAPDEWTRQEEILMNNHYPAKSKWSGGELPKWMSDELEAYVLSKHPGEAEYCLAILCDRQEPINVMTEATKPPAVKEVRRKGRNVWNDEEPSDRNLWVISMWTFHKDRPQVETLKHMREEVIRNMLRRLGFDLRSVASRTANQNHWRDVGELLHVLNKQGPVDWKRLAELCESVGLPIPPMVKMMKEAVAAAGYPEARQEAIIHTILTHAIHPCILKTPIVIKECGHGTVWVPLKNDLGKLLKSEKLQTTCLDWKIFARVMAQAAHQEDSEKVSSGSQAC